MCKKETCAAVLLRKRILSKFNLPSCGTMFFIFKKEGNSLLFQRRVRVD